MKEKKRVHMLKGLRGYLIRLHKKRWEEMLKRIKALEGRSAFSMSLVGPIKDVGDKAHLSFCVCFVSVLISDILRAQDTFSCEFSLQLSFNFWLIIHTVSDLMCF